MCCRAEYSHSAATLWKSQVFWFFWFFLNGISGSGFDLIQWNLFSAFDPSQTCIYIYTHADRNGEPSVSTSSPGLPQQGISSAPQSVPQSFHGQMVPDEVSGPATGAFFSWMCQKNHWREMSRGPKRSTREVQWDENQPSAYWWSQNHEVNRTISPTKSRDSLLRSLTQIPSSSWLCLRSCPLLQQTDLDTGGNLSKSNSS